MKIIEAHKLAMELKNKYGLDDWDVRFSEWTDYSGVIASCFEYRKLLEFSPKYFAINNKEFCKDQILHEIAHALAGYDAAHGDEWKDKCKEIGAIPHEVWEGYHSLNTPYGERKAHKGSNRVMKIPKKIVIAGQEVTVTLVRSGIEASYKGGKPV